MKETLVTLVPPIGKLNQPTKLYPSLVGSTSTSVDKLKPCGKLNWYTSKLSPPLESKVTALKIAVHLA